MKTDQPIQSFPHPYVTVDVIVCTILNEQLNIALIKRGIDPYKGMWALPGGFVRTSESLEAAAARELEEEVGVQGVYLEQLYTFGEPDRDPRDRVITVAYFALIPSGEVALRGSGDAREAQWFPISDLPDLAFDHPAIINDALARIRAKLEYSNVAFALLPPQFSLSELQQVYEVILNEKLDKRNFRKKMLTLSLLEPTGEKKAEGAHRPAALYRFTSSHLQVF